MNTLRKYLLCEETRLWLDVMVWSSAQPHKVEKMVRRCFNLERPYSYAQRYSENPYWSGTLHAVWARDTLGLSAHAYSTRNLSLRDHG